MCTFKDNASVLDARKAARAVVAGILIPIEVSSHDWSANEFHEKLYQV